MRETIYNIKFLVKSKWKKNNIFGILWSIIIYGKEAYRGQTYENSSWFFFFDTWKVMMAQIKNCPKKE